LDEPGVGLGMTKNVKMLAGFKLIVANEYKDFIFLDSCVIFCGEVLSDVNCYSFVFHIVFPFALLIRRVCSGFFMDALIWLKDNVYVFF
jgi:hypothetical protein